MIGLESAAGVVVYYKPFDIQTLLPVTPENIELQANCVFVVPQDDPLLTDVISILTNAPPGLFDEKVVRVKLVLPGKGIFVDQDGGVLTRRVTDRQQRIPADHFARLKSSLVELAHEHGCTLEPGTS